MNKGLVDHFMGKFHRFHSLASFFGSPAFFLLCVSCFYLWTWDLLIGLSSTISGLGWIALLLIICFAIKDYVGLYNLEFEFYLLALLSDNRLSSTFYIFSSLLSSYFFDLKSIISTF